MPCSRHRCAGFGLFEDRHDLAVGESGLLHFKFPCRGNSTFDHCGLTGGLPILGRQRNPH